MEIKVVAGSIQSFEDELIVVNLFEGIEHPGGATGAVDQAMGAAISEAIAAGDFRGKLGETALFYSRGSIPATRVISSAWIIPPGDNGSGLPWTQAGPVMPGMNRIRSAGISPPSVVTT